MAYTPTVWANGDTITATLLNKLETGLQSASPFIIHEADDGVLDKTWQEIYNAMSASIFCISIYTQNNDVVSNVTINYIQSIVLQEGAYTLVYGDGTPFSASTANDYPVLVD